MDLKTNSIIKNAGIGFFIFVILAVVLLSIGEFAYGKFLSFYFPKPFCLYCRHALAGIVGVISFIEMLVFIFIRNKKISILDFVSAVLFSIITSWVIIWCRKRSIPTHSERLNPSSFTAKLALKSA